MITPGNYKAHNILHKVNYWKSIGIDPSFLFENTDINYQQIKQTDWFDFLTQVHFIWKNELKKVPNPRDHVQLGYDVYRNQSMGSVELIAKLVSLKFIFKKFSDFGRQYSLVENYETYNVTRNSAVLIYSPKVEFITHFSYSSPLFIKGFLMALPNIHLPSIDHNDNFYDAEVELEYSCFDVENVLKNDFHWLRHKLNWKWENDLFYVNGELIGKKRKLYIEPVKKTLFSTRNPSKKYIFSSSHSQHIRLTKMDSKIESEVVLITDDFYVDNTLILKKGEIFNAPYCRFNISWSNTSLLKRIQYFLFDVPSIIKNSREDLLKQIEIADQRYFNEMKAKQELFHANTKLKEYAENLEKKVNERTLDLKAKNETLQNIENNLKKYLPKQLVDTITTGRQFAVPKTERRKLTVFFSDIKGFTDMTESLEAEDLSYFLNQYLTEMTNIAHKWGGTVDKFIGDAIMIFFGAPEKTPDKNNAINCVKMAVEMQQKMKILQTEWFNKGLEHQFEIRIGISSGVSTVGNFGTEDRLSYTVIGGQVNIASRLESLCEPGSILLSHQTWAFVKDEIQCTPRGKVSVKGINRELMVYDVKI